MSALLPLIPPTLHAQFSVMVEDATGQVPGNAYLNYLILDPTVPDPGGVLPGMPIYVGQTASIAQRIKLHMVCALGTSARPGSVYARIADIITKGSVPVFRVLEVHRNRVACMDAETVWAQRLLRSGAALTNKGREQGAIVPDREVARMQKVRLLNLTLAEARVSGMALEAICRKRCSRRVMLPADLISEYRAITPLHTVRKRTRFCPKCGALNRHMVVQLDGGSALSGANEGVMQITTQLPATDTAFDPVQEHQQAKNAGQQRDIQEPRATLVPKRNEGTCRHGNEEQQAYGFEQGNPLGHDGVASQFNG
eukprot:gene15588-15735_t